MEEKFDFEKFCRESEIRRAEWEALPEEEKERRRAKMDTGLAERMGSYEQVKSDDSPTK